VAGLPRGLRAADDHLQPLPPLGAAGALATPAAGARRRRARRRSPDRQHDRQGASLGGRRKRGAQAQAIGRSRGGRTTKIHAVVDGRGRPLAFTLSAGHRHDAPIAPALVQALPAAKLCAADAAYDSAAFRQLLIARGTLPVLPNNPTRKRRHPFDPLAYRLRNLIERAFCRLKDWRRIGTRYDKLAVNYAAAVSIAIRHLVDLIESTP
jgi:transposase